MTVDHRRRSSGTARAELDPALTFSWIRQRKRNNSKGIARSSVKLKLMGFFLLFSFATGTNKHELSTAESSPGIRVALLTNKEASVASNLTSCAMQWSAILPEPWRLISKTKNNSRRNV